MSDSSPIYTYYQCDPVYKTFTGVINVACGDLHSIALKNDGTIECWGFYHDVIHKTFKSVIKIACGEYYSVALKDDGTIWINLGDSYAGSGGAGNQFDQIENGLSPYKQTGSPKDIGLKPKDLIGIPWRVAFALQADGWYLRSDIIWHKPNPMPESVKDRPTKSHEYIFLMSKNRTYYYDQESIKTPVKQENIKGTTTHKRSTKDWGDGTGVKTHNGFDKSYDMANKRDVWTVPTDKFEGQHFATFPKELIKPCILAGCPEGGTVLDPFNGSGTTCIVSLQNNRKYIGIELNPEYCIIAHKRISTEVSPLISIME